MNQFEFESLANIHMQQAFRLFAASQVDGDDSFNAAIGAIYRASDAYNSAWLKRVTNNARVHIVDLLEGLPDERFSTERNVYQERLERDVRRDYMSDKTTFGSQYRYKG